MTFQCVIFDKMFYQKNEKLISVSFTAVIQTLRANPQMGSLIYSIPSANNSQQDKDNSNNITKCLESNKIVYEV
ncbi:MAG TPA: hypothetical protein VKA95_16555 [Nitrososphaeraceae archaeon]|nr:hypothetical protein [Nitrososphaeraceae archaeon]